VLLGEEEVLSAQVLVTLLVGGVDAGRLDGELHDDAAGWPGSITIEPWNSWNRPETRPIRWRILNITSEWALSSV